VRTATRLGLLFPGQGSQLVGMGRDLIDAFPEARQTFEEADDALGFSLSRLAWEASASELTLTMNAQPAILVHSVAVWRVLQRVSPAVTMATGHSLGEFSAHVASGTLDFSDAVRAVRRRGELMYGSGADRPGSMAAVIGLDDAVVEAACSEASHRGEGIVVAANFNAPGQVVISGDDRAVHIADSLLRAAGARRVLPLNVSGAFHSPLMSVAEEGLREQLESMEFRDPAFPVVSNVTGHPVDSGATARQLLVDQLTSPVHWVASMRTMLAAGITDFLEVGPGHVLTGLLRRIEKSAKSRPLGTEKELSDFLAGEG
jgi:[acyl-carrier-protein] S-malonyltransferase